MGFFGKKKTKVEENNESVLKEELKTEVESNQNEFRTKQDEITNITEKIKTVKEEYDTTVSNLMLQIKDTKSINEFNKTEKEFKKIKEELDKMKKEHNEIKEQIVKGQSSLHGIRKQQVEVGKELDEANSRLYNAKKELDEKDQFQDTSILTPKEKKDIKGENTSEKTNTGVIEAASIVVGSLKSKLTITQKELEQIQGLLEEEREAHKKTRQELMKIKSDFNH